jgi:hypothetical protein
MALAGSMEPELRPELDHAVRFACVFKARSQRSDGDGEQRAARHVESRLVRIIRRQRRRRTSGRLSCV